MAWALYLVGMLFVVASTLDNGIRTRPSDGKRIWLPVVAASWPILALGFVAVRLLRRKTNG